MKDNLNCAQDGEAREETHCTSDESKCSLRCHLFILFYVVVRRCAQVDVHQLHAVGHLGLWGMKLKIKINYLFDLSTSIFFGLIKLDISGPGILEGVVLTNNLLELSLVEFSVISRYGQIMAILLRIKHLKHIQA